MVECALEEDLGLRGVSLEYLCNELYAENEEAWLPSASASASTSRTSRSRPIGAARGHVTLLSTLVALDVAHVPSTRPTTPRYR